MWRVFALWTSAIAWEVANQAKRSWLWRLSCLPNVPDTLNSTFLLTVIWKNMFFVIHLCVFWMLIDILVMEFLNNDWSSFLFFPVLFLLMIFLCGMLLLIGRNVYMPSIFATVYFIFLNILFISWCVHSVQSSITKRLPSNVKCLISPVCMHMKWSGRFAILHFPVHQIKITRSSKCLVSIISLTAFVCCFLTSCNVYLYLLLQFSIFVGVALIGYYGEINS